MQVYRPTRSQWLSWKHTLCFVGVFGSLVSAMGRDTCLLPFSDFDSSNGERYSPDSRQYLVPSMNFTCSGRITAWKLGLLPTNSDNLSPVGTIDLQVWGTNRQGCTVLKDWVTYFQLTDGGDFFNVQLTDSQYILNFDEGDFLGFFIYEHGLSPGMDPLTSNMTVLLTQRRQSFCNLTARTIERSEQSPFISVQLETFTSAPSVSVNVTSTPTPAILAPLTLSLVSALGAVFLAVVVLVGCMVILVPVVIVQRRKIRAKNSNRITLSVPDDPPVNKDNFSIESENVDKQWTVEWMHVKMSDNVEGSHGNDICKGFISRQGLPPAARHHPCRDNVLPVLIKMVHRDSVTAQKSFWNELRLLQQLSSSSNPHIVKMMGFLPAHPAAVLIEYSIHGNLLSFLQSYKPSEDVSNPVHRPIASSSRQFGRNCYLTTPLVLPQDGHPDGASQGLEDDYAEPYALLGRIKEDDLMSFAQQIASGMEYLSSVNVVHRDLACRNIMVFPGKVLKIAEFGLARTADLYVSSRTPITWQKWMAPEAIFHRVFSEKSDVWSYGVCMWELCTLGREPYPLLKGEEILSRLQSGYRMERPGTCSEQIYKVMWDCWNWEPGRRPRFSDIHSHLYQLIEENSSGGGYIRVRNNSNLISINVTHHPSGIITSPPLGNMTNLHSGNATRLPLSNTTHLPSSNTTHLPLGNYSHFAEISSNNYSTHEYEKIYH